MFCLQVSAAGCSHHTLIGSGAPAHPSILSVLTRTFLRCPKAGRTLCLCTVLHSSARFKSGLCLPTSLAPPVKLGICLELLVVLPKFVVLLYCRRTVTWRTSTLMWSLSRGAAGSAATSSTCGAWLQTESFCGVLPLCGSSMIGWNSERLQRQEVCSRNATGTANRARSISTLFLPHTCVLATYPILCRWACGLRLLSSTAWTSLSMRVCELTACACASSSANMLT